MLPTAIALDAGAVGTSIMLLIGLVVGTALYFVPSIIAVPRGHHQVGAVIAINALLGWLIIGWVVALAMALSAKRQETVVQNFVAPVGYPQQK